MYSGTTPYDHCIITTVYYCAPDELRVQRFPYFTKSFNPTIPLLRPNYYGPEVVVLTGLSLYWGFWQFIDPWTRKMNRKKTWRNFNAERDGSGRGTKKLVWLPVRLLKRLLKSPTTPERSHYTIEFIRHSSVENLMVKVCPLLVQQRRDWILEPERSS